MDRGLGIDWQVNPLRQPKLASSGNGVGSADAGQLVFIYWQADFALPSRKMRSVRE
jgi:hypothetical protein